MVNFETSILSHLQEVSEVSISCLTIAFSSHCREPTGLVDLVVSIRSRCGVKLPSSHEDWATFPRTHILVRGRR